MVSRCTPILLLLAAASPAASQTTSREIAEIADISGLVVSPDGRSVAYRVERPSTVTNRIDVDWYVTSETDPKTVLHLGRVGTALWNDAGSILPGEAQWTADSRTILVRALVDGRISLWASAIDGSGFREVASGDGDIEGFAMGVASSVIIREGPSRSAIARAEETERDTGILFDASVDLTQPLFRGASIHGRPSSQRFAGDWFDRVPLLSDQPRTYYVLNLASGERRPASEAEKARLATVPAADMSQAFINALETRNICLEPTGCRSDATRTAWHSVLRDGRTLVALRKPSGGTTIMSWSPTHSTLRPFAASTGQLSSGRSGSRPCASTISSLFCVEASATIAPRLVRFDMGTLHVVDAPNPVPDSDGLLAETIAWQVSGSRASGVLIRPEVPGRLPLFVTYYRCNGYVRGGTGDEWPLRALARHGIAALCINVLPGGSVAQERYDIGLDTVRAAIDYLSRRGVVDATKVGMGGLSFGSEVAMWTAIHSDLLKTVSIASVQIEPSYYWFNARPGRETFNRNVRKNWKLGPPDAEPENWKEISAALNVDRLHIPVLMQLPESEARQSAELMSKLASRHMGEAHLFPLAPHLKVEPRQKLAAYERNLDWFRFWLKGEMDPDPRKAAQYQRWAALAPKKGEASIERTQRSMSAISSKRK